MFLLSMIFPMLIIINKQSKIPLIGLIQIGIIDRGTNLLQIRPTTICNLDCIFCSTNHPLHQNNYIAEKSYLIETLKEIIKEKQTNIEANIDSVGGPTTYENLIPLIEEISKIKEVNFISMQTNGTLLTKQLIKQLEKANLNRINLSIHTLDENKAKILANNKNYNLKHILNIINFIKTTKIELNLTPVWIPEINDNDIKELIKFVKKHNIKISIQKYEETKFSKKLRKKMNWKKFYKELKNLENKYKIKLIATKEDFNIKETKRIEKPINKGEVLNAKLLAAGWYKDQSITSYKNRAITIINQKFILNKIIKIKIIDDSNNIYLAKKI